MGRPDGFEMPIERNVAGPHWISFVGLGENQTMVLWDVPFHHCTFGEKCQSTHLPTCA